MNPKIKDVLGMVGVAALAILIVGVLQFSSAYSRSVPPTATFAASGEGRVTAVPDTAEFSFGINTDGGKDIAALQADNTKKANDAIAFVKSKGVDAKDITTTGYNVTPRYQYYTCAQPLVSSANGASAPDVKPCPPSEVVGYTISQTVSVKIRDFSKIGDVLSGVATRGANNISSLNFTVHDKDQVEKDARAKAIQQAEDKAQAFAKAGHFRLGRVVSISENGSTPPVFYSKYEMAADGRGGAASAPAPTIEPGSQEIVSTITITYEIR